MHACNDFLLRRLCCVDKNNHARSEIKVGYEWSSFYVSVYVDGNNASLLGASLYNRDLFCACVDGDNVSAKKKLER